MTNDALSQQFMNLYEEWGAAIASKRHDWLEDFFSDDFLGTAQPWPTLSVNKHQMIELDKSIEAMETKWLKVIAHKTGDEIITLGFVKYLREDFKEDASIAEGMPSGQEIAALTHGKVAAYVNGWRHNGQRWQVFDHHLVGLVDEHAI